MSSDAALKVNTWTRLLEAYERIERKPSEPTYLELAGFPHYENVISNLLAFFLTPAAEHKLGGLTLGAFCTFLGIRQELSNVQIDREVQTGAGRIDIVINSDTDVIAIENKIYHHSESNPFADYVSHVRHCHPEKKHHFLILTPFPSSLHGRRQELEELGFKVLSYGALFTNIRCGMGAYAVDASAKYWMLLLDLIRSIENLSRGTSMETSLLTFFQMHSDALASLLREFAQVRSEMRNKVTALHGKIRDLASAKLENRELVSEGAYYREQDQLFDTLFFDIQFPNEARVACDVIINVAGWQIVVHPRNRANFLLLKNALGSIGMQCQEVDGRFSLAGLGEPLTYTADLEEVADIVIGVLNRLSAEAMKTVDRSWVK